MRNHRQPWTDRDDKTLQLMVRTGYGGAEMAERLGRSLKSIEHRKHQLRLVRQNRIEWSASDDAALARMKRNGAGATRIAAKLGRTRNSIIGRAWRLSTGNISRSTA